MKPTGIVAKMPLPEQLHQKLTELEPNLIQLEQNEFDQLNSYLRYPDLLCYPPRQLMDEDRQGITTARDHLKRFLEFHKYLRRISDYNERCKTTVRQRSNNSGRPVQSDLQVDKKIYDDWNTKKYPTKDELANAYNVTLNEVDKAIDRQRKR